MSDILRGAPVAEALTRELAGRAEKLRSAGISPCLAILRIGEAAADISYESAALRRCEKVGIEVKRFILPESRGPEGGEGGESRGPEGCGAKELKEALAEINGDPAIHGCLFFRPLEDKALERRICESLNPEKDVDCAGPQSLAAVFSGEGKGYAPCTAEAVTELLKFYGIPLRGANVCVVGRSLVTGRPSAMLLMREDATVTVCHSATRDLPEICRRADIIVSAAGKAGMIGLGHVSASSVVVDVGTNTGADGRLCGDADFDALKDLCRAISPVPGGVGSVTSAVLAKHVVEAAEKLL